MTPPPKKMRAEICVHDFRISAGRTLVSVDNPIGPLTGAEEGAIRGVADDVMKGAEPDDEEESMACEWRGWFDWRASHLALRLCMTSTEHDMPRRLAAADCRPSRLKHTDTEPLI